MSQCLNDPMHRIFKVNIQNGYSLPNVNVTEFIHVMPLISILHFAK